MGSGSGGVDPKEETINNILKALYQSSTTIKFYVDAVALGNKIPYTILIRDIDMERNAKIVKDLMNYIESQKGVDFAANEFAKGGADVIDELIALVDVK